MPVAAHGQRMKKKPVLDAQEKNGPSHIDMDQPHAPPRQPMPGGACHQGVSKKNQASMAWQRARIERSGILASPGRGRTATGPGHPGRGRIVCHKEANRTRSIWITKT